MKLARSVFGFKNVLARAIYVTRVTLNIAIYAVQVCSQLQF